MTAMYNPFLDLNLKAPILQRNSVMMVMIDTWIWLLNPKIRLFGQLTFGPFRHNQQN